jgi:hypothetical protein
MAEGVSASMPMVLKMVGDAIGLDSQNRKKVTLSSDIAGIILKLYKLLVTVKKCLEL